MTPLVSFCVFMAFFMPKIRSYLFASSNLTQLRQGEYIIQPFNGEGGLLLSPDGAFVLNRQQTNDNSEFLFSFMEGGEAAISVNVMDWKKNEVQKILSAGTAF
ncbi:hypothetical protein [Paenibacillus sp. PL91]|uniref:hypothetical protein n=1 Tax=Paenibacillus sp. PL91 TaxID=2729538 RepID=UPI00145DD32C|nr:hypothetical protein [Paenibacillus sp. PL91]MBC9205021.1 hypothetical protein [Paenibacillus sp. PL91]